MSHTIFNTFGITFFLRSLTLLFLKLTGWRIEGDVPTEKKFIIIAAPHTSNWDLPYGLFYSLILRIKPYWLGKKELFQGPLRLFFRFLGGIPIDRVTSHNMVDQMVSHFQNREHFILILAPEGTRSEVKKWKSGFYYIALKAGVPIVLDSIDRSRKVWGIGPLFWPKGNYEQDLHSIQEFYAPILLRNLKNISNG